MNSIYSLKRKKATDTLVAFFNLFL